MAKLFCKRQVNRILQADAQLAVLDHLLDARRVGQNRLRHVRWRIGRDDIGEPSLAVRVVLIRYLGSSELEPEAGQAARRRRGLPLLLGENWRDRRLCPSVQPSIRQA